MSTLVELGERNFFVHGPRQLAWTHKYTEVQWGGVYALSVGVTRWGSPDSMSRLQIQGLLELRGTVSPKLGQVRP